MWRRAVKIMCILGHTHAFTFDADVRGSDFARLSA